MAAIVLQEKAIDGRLEVVVATAIEGPIVAVAEIGRGVTTNPEIVRAADRATSAEGNPVLSWLRALRSSPRWGFCLRHELRASPQGGGRGGGAP